MDDWERFQELKRKNAHTGGQPGPNWNSPQQGPVPPAHNQQPPMGQNPYQQPYGPGPVPPQGGQFRPQMPGQPPVMPGPRQPPVLPPKGNPKRKKSIVFWVLMASAVSTSVLFLISLAYVFFGG